VAHLAPLVGYFFVIGQILLPLAILLWGTKGSFLQAHAKESLNGQISYTPYWRTGFYYMALKAGVPIALGYADYRRKEVGIGAYLYPTGDIREDFALIREFYQGQDRPEAGKAGAHPHPGRGGPRGGNPVDSPHGPDPKPGLWRWGGGSFTATPSFSAWCPDQGHHRQGVGALVAQGEEGQ
jgi:hypothetical protein